MKNKNDRGPAFPNGETVGQCSVLTGGMTLRDYFSGQALAGVMGNSEYERLRQSLDGVISDDKQHQILAEMTYSIADAMLAERNK